jgi:hypothetical protein
MDCVQLKQVLLIIQVLKYGKEKNMDENVIYGQLVVYFTKCALSIHLLGQKIFLVFIEKLSLVIMTLSQVIIPNS